VTGAELLAMLQQFPAETLALPVVAFNGSWDQSGADVTGLSIGNATGRPNCVYGRWDSDGERVLWVDTA
jgi:hypothetical protein